MESLQFAQLRMHEDPGAVQAKPPKIVIDGLPGTVLTRQIPPRTAAAQDIKDPIADAAHVQRAGATTRLGGGNERCEHCPLCLVEVAGVHWDCHAKDALRKMLNTHFG